MSDAARSFKTVDHFRRIKGFTVGGATEKDVLQDPRSGHRYIAKLGGRNNDIEVMTEYAIYLIGRSLGVTVAGARIVRYQGRLRFLSQYFLDLERSEELVHGVQLFRELYDETTVQAVVKKQAREQLMFSVQSVKAAFGAHYMHYGAGVEDDLFGRFLEMLTHDALIGVMDRHHENWGVIVQRDVAGPQPRFAPLYDSARGLFCSETDAQLAQRNFWTDQVPALGRYVLRARPLVGCNGQLPALGRNFLNHVELLGAVYRAYPAHRSRIRRILNACDFDEIRAMLSGRLAAICSPRRRQLIVECLQLRQRNLLEAVDAAE